VQKTAKLDKVLEVRRKHLLRTNGLVEEERKPKIARLTRMKEKREGLNQEHQTNFKYERLPVTPHTWGPEPVNYIAQKKFTIHKREGGEGKRLPTPPPKKI